MNYEKIYKQLIAKCKLENTKTDTFYEYHHIYPCVLCRYSHRYGEQTNYIFNIDADNPSNIVKMVPREHFIAHLLLSKIYPKTKIVFATHLMRKRAKNSRIHTIISTYVSNYQKSLITNNSHNFQISNNVRIKNGTHNFLKDKNGDSMSKRVNAKRLKEGTHHWQGERGSKFATERNLLLVSEGRHPMQNENTILKCKETRRKRVESGEWHTKGIRPWNNNSSKYNSKLIYSKANDLFIIWSKNPSYGSRKLAKIIGFSPAQSFQNILKMFRNGWIPNQDNEWLDFKSSFVEQ